mmetsp:Transcript_1387/g.2967  ORF Transcript_1387/g.2967 Transcript_1387/m.2967 type:complete len:397 (+) Transcript_1387:86-1276(+)
MLNAPPEKMRAAQCTDYSENNNISYEVLSVQNDIVPTPRLGIDTPPSGFEDVNAMLIKVLAVSLAPGDVRVLSGKTRKFQGPPSFPYTPGGDICGVVVSLPEEESEEEKKKKKKKGKGTNEKCKFNIGDRVAARFVNKPMGMLGEYALVSTEVCDVVPECLSAEGAAALVSSGTVALILGDRIRDGDRVLIFGAGGGIGSHLCQLARVQGASYVAGVGRDPQRLTEKPLGCDRAIDYTAEDPFAVKEWVDDPFDVIVDLAGVWPSLVKQTSRHQSIIKSASKGGRYLTTTPDKSEYELRSVWSAMKTFLFPALWRAMCTRGGVSRYHLPKYSYVMALPSEPNVVTRTLALASESKIVPCIDEQGPFAFDTEGVRDAFRLQGSHHAKGKVVITVSKE